MRLDFFPAVGYTVIDVAGDGLSGVCSQPYGLHPKGLFGDSPRHCSRLCQVNRFFQAVSGSAK